MLWRPTGAGVRAARQLRVREPVSVYAGHDLLQAHPQVIRTPLFLSVVRTKELVLMERRRLVMHLHEGCAAVYLGRA